MSDALQHSLADLPSRPGVYLYKNAAGKVIYVGKAVDLRRRVRSYFQSGKGHSPKTVALVQAVESLETIVTLSEVEALILEENLIKRFRPRYNVLWKDDKRYPYLQLTLSEDYPRLLVTRRPHLAKDRYFGPFVHVSAMRTVQRLVHRKLGIRQCDIEIDRKLARPCLYYDLGQCDAPCVAWGETQAQYAGHVEQVKLLLEGRDRALEASLGQKMQAASEAEQFEEAARFRDSIEALKLLRQRQRIVLAEARDIDVIALAPPTATVFFVRGGKLIDWQVCKLSHSAEADPAEALASFVLQFYAGEASVPEEILLSHALDEPEALQAWLTRKRGSKALLSWPQRGDKHQLLRMVEQNAAELMRQGLAEEPEPGPRRAPGRDVVRALQELADALGLPEPPRRIEGFDISHIQGSQTVASMVVMLAGLPAPREYRSYKMRTVKGVDDFASMNEVVGRRYRRVLDEKLPLPDLILIDGGPGQLSAALGALKALGLERLPCVGLAKRLEELFIPGRDQSLRLDGRSPGRLLLQRLRDEAHRFAVTFHRKLRSKALTHSALDDVAGIGPVLKKKLLQAFGSVEGLRQAEDKAVLALEGVGPGLLMKLRATIKTAAPRGSV